MAVFKNSVIQATKSGIGFLFNDEYYGSAYQSIGSVEDSTLTLKLGVYSSGRANNTPGTFELELSTLKIKDKDGNDITGATNAEKAEQVNVVANFKNGGGLGIVGVSQYVQSAEQAIPALTDTFVIFSSAESIGRSGITLFSSTELLFEKGRDYSGAIGLSLKNELSQVAEGLVTPQLDDGKGGGYVDSSPVAFSVNDGTGQKPSVSAVVRSNVIKFFDEENSVKLRYKINSSDDITLLRFDGQYYTWGL